MTALAWLDGDEGFDIHLLPGKRSRRLNECLYLKWNDKWVRADTPIQDVSVAFLGRIIISAPDGSLSDYCLEISPTTGQVTVLTGTPSKPLNNFLIEATVKDIKANNALKIAVRVHIHTGIAKIWLTPSPLTIKKNAHQGFRLTLLAQFDDQVVGDITRWPDITWSSSDASVISFAKDKDQATAPYPDGQEPNKNPEGWLHARTSDSKSSTVTAKLPTGHNAQAPVKTEGDWTSENIADFVGGAGVDMRDSVPNIIFLSEGFTKNEARQFTDLVLKIVLSLGTNRITKPYNLLMGSMNYWSAFLPSPERGASILYPLLMESFQNQSRCGTPVPQPIPPPSDSTSWTIENLIYIVGLPLVADQTITFQTKKNYWINRYPNFKESAVTSSLFDEWKRYADYRLASETDTAWGMRFGERPKAENGEADRSILLNPFRADSEDLNNFLFRLKNRKGGAFVGERWCSGKPDGERIYVLCGGTRHGGAKGIVAASALLTTNDVAVTPDPVSRAAKIVPLGLPAPNNLDPSVATTVAHESAHSFGLLDEYCEVALQFPQGSRDLSKAANVQSREDVVVKVIVQGVTLEKIDPEKLKWLWPRITKAGVLSEAPSGTGNIIKLKLRPTHAGQFKVGDMVRLRRRPLLAHPEPSKDWLTVTAVQGDSLQLSLPVGYSFRSADYPVDKDGDCIVFCSVTNPPIPPATFSTVDQKLIAKSVYDHIKTNGGPLNAPASDPLRACVMDYESIQPIQNGPPGLIHSATSRFVVGAFDGGAGYGCGIYHPTGTCKMRTFETAHGKNVEFCHVCRYFLIDLINPTKHGKIDEDLVYPTQ
ncbi:MAG TPA: hypothetical protein VN643_12015 [Pyrinomonadaceae bacterium]|nr:hypothetical protein [Pyrinomonadaceae bacterium]